MLLIASIGYASPTIMGSGMGRGRVRCREPGDNSDPTALSVCARTAANAASGSTERAPPASPSPSLFLLLVFCERVLVSGAMSWMEDMRVFRRRGNVEVNAGSRGESGSEGGARKTTTLSSTILDVDRVCPGRPGRARARGGASSRGDVGALASIEASSNDSVRPRDLSSRSTELDGL